MKYIKHERSYLSTVPNTEKRVENTTLGGVFLTNFQLVGSVLEHYLELVEFY